MSQIAAEVHADIIRLLLQIENDHQVRILYACESGSRAWGFESQDSDYDVRFIYVRPHDAYVAIDVETHRDVIELPIRDLLDINGWDLRKALQLFHKSNPPLNEWLHSPIVYLKRGTLTDQLREMAPASYNPLAARYHYARMAEKNLRACLKGDTVRRKKYLYVLRPLLAVNWIERGLGVVPTEFDRLVAGTVSDAELLSGIEELLRIKRAGREADAGPRIPAIDAFIESELTGHGSTPRLDGGSRADVAKLNELFRTIIASDAATPKQGV
jgi:predicted nucleotidyltransferase